MMPLDVLEERSQAVARSSGWARTTSGTSILGGGSAPGVEIPSVGIAWDADVVQALLRVSPPVVARVESGRTICDLRTIDPSHDTLLATSLKTVTNR